MITTIILIVLSFASGMLVDYLLWRRPKKVHKPDEGEKPKVRDKAPGIWIEGNSMGLPASLLPIKEIYKKEELPFKEELEALAYADLIALFKNGAFKYDHEEKNRILRVALDKVHNEDLTEFYENFAHKGRQYETIIAERIITILENNKGESEIDGLNKIEPQQYGRLAKYFKLKESESKNVSQEQQNMKAVKKDENTQTEAKEAV